MKQTLLIIDAQQDLIEGSPVEEAVFKKEHLISTINKVIEKASKCNVSVVFVRDLDVAEGRGKGFQVHENIHVPKDAKSFDKSATNSFHGTGLLDHLRSQAIQHVVIMGCVTQHCIDTAVRTATVKGFDVTLVGDGHSTTDSKVLSAEQIINHHNETLHGHYNVDHFSMVRNSDEDLFTPLHHTYR
ncbi:isochorismatase family protein [Mesobacillus maritimus]|uniref:Isochorismatase family protein n=1 Tax=Mesobacillus maritimus TaxID=1643336 RepID=A0ABS7K0C0_9BACI|nr:isochorismatase family protein [Mesobacillus maritimus]MBY0095663.1 isochorismatase family protein [Mesobacillus maritimus]